MTLPIDIRDRELRSLDQFDLREGYQEDLQGVLVARREIDDCVERLAAEITADYRGNSDFYPICVLKGAIRFFVDLTRAIELGASYSEAVVNASRYGKGPVSDTPEVQIFDPESIAGKDVLIVEDILDEGHTLAALVDRIEEHDPNSVEIASLFSKATNREVDVDPTYEGFLIPDRFVVGYGLDYQELHRDFPHLGVIDTDQI